MLAQIFDLACDVSPGVKRLLIKNWFQYLTKLDKEALMIFMNFGYAPLDASAEKVFLRENDEINRYCIQMYHHVASAVDLHDRKVLEVGSGRGGGSSYIMRYLRPASMTGIDISKNAVAFCNNHHRVEGLHYQHGDAENLPFEDNSFDAIVNIESSYGYGDMERFLSEVVRVLRPGGHFLFADYRNGDKVEKLRQQLRDTGMQILRDECITPNVLKALDLDSERKIEVIKQKVPKFLYGVFLHFAATKGSEPYEELRTGAVDYRSFTLRKHEA